MWFPSEAPFVLDVQQLVFSTPWMPFVVIFCARWLIFVNGVCAIALYFSSHQRARHAAIESLWSVGLALLFTALIALVVQRARPFLVISDVIRLIPPPFNTSFPSGHTAASIAFALASWKGRRMIGLISFVIAGFVAMSRIAVGVHFPSDLFGGLLVGGASFYMVRMGHAALRRRFLS